MNATTYTKDYDGNRDPYAQARIEAVNFVAANGDKMRVPVELLRQLIAELDEEGGWLGRVSVGRRKGGGGGGFVDLPPAEEKYNDPSSATGSAGPSPQAGEARAPSLFAFILSNSACETNSLAKPHHGMTCGVSTEFQSKSDSF